MRGNSHQWHFPNGRTVKAQALVEFALALPIMLLVVYGLLETGRLIFIYSAVTTSSREGARYASASGVSTSGGTILHYQDCTGIRKAAKNTGIMLGLSDAQIQIAWDGPNRSPAVGRTPYCAAGTATAPTVHLTAGDRVLVRVSTSYTLLVPLVPFTSRTISSGDSARTFIGTIDLSPTPHP